MDLPPALSQACRQGRLLVLWGALPFPLVAQPPPNRALALNQWAAQAEPLPPPALALARLPPLPFLSLDPTARVEWALARAGLPLQVVCTRHDVPARSRHVLLKLAGDLGTRSGVVLSHSEVRELQNDPDKRHLLDEARRLAGDGALLLLGCDPADQDFRAWWSVLAPALGGAALFALGEPSAAWPPGVTCLEPDLEAVNAALWAVQPPAPEKAEPTAPFQPQAQAEAKYVINVYGTVAGLTAGDGVRVEQHFGPPVQAVQGDWEALVAQVVARLDALSAQLGQGVDDLKRGQAALYRQADRAYRHDLARILAAVQQGRLEQGEMRATLDALRRAMRVVIDRGLPMDAELRAAMADLTEAVESSLSLERKLELSLPLLPLLTYKIELGVGSEVDLHDLWNELRTRWRRLVEQFGSRDTTQLV
jgi:hypothetical protein